MAHLLAVVPLATAVRTVVCQKPDFPRSSFSWVQSGVILSITYIPEKSLTSLTLTRTKP